MSVLEIVLLLLLGLILLFIGAEALIRGSSALALRFGISPLVVGLTVVAFGTSSPELVVSINSSLKGNGGIALGNILGSNICNIALILGTSALIKPLIVQAQVVKREIPIMIGVSVLLFILSLNNEISRLEGFIFFAGIIVYIIISIYLSKKEKNSEVKKEFEESIPNQGGNLWKSVLFVIAGLGLLAVGAKIFVDGAVAAAERMGVSQVVIGLTVVAIGTSLPELITSVVAAFKNEADIAIGNIVGSNVFNILSILGVTAIISPVSTSDAGLIDFSLMLLTAILLLPLSWSGYKLSRWEGGFFFAGYIVYMLYLLKIV
jgi:cation:H+ antiporter